MGADFNVGMMDARVILPAGIMLFVFQMYAVERLAPTWLAIGATIIYVGWWIVVDYMLEPPETVDSSDVEN